MTKNCLLPSFLQKKFAEIVITFILSLFYFVDIVFYLEMNTQHHGSDWDRAKPENSSISILVSGPIYIIKIRQVY